MKTRKTINNTWNEYDRSVAQCMLYNYGIIFLDSYGCPVDDEYQQEDLYNEYLERERK